MPDNYLDALQALRAQVAPAPEEAPAPEPRPQPRRNATLEIAYERKGRGGKQACIVSGFPAEMSEADIADIAAQIKRRLATGGSARGGEILIQGDRRADLRTALAALGWKVKG